jgi:hypothetical protein
VLPRACAAAALAVPFFLILFPPQRCKGLACDKPWSGGGYRRNDACCVGWIEGSRLGNTWQRRGGSGRSERVFRERVQGRGKGTRRGKFRFQDGSKRGQVRFKPSCVVLSPALTPAFISGIGVPCHPLLPCPWHRLFLLSHLPYLRHILPFTHISRSISSSSSNNNSSSSGSIHPSIMHPSHRPPPFLPPPAPCPTPPTPSPPPHSRCPPLTQPRTQWPSSRPRRRRRQRQQMKCLLLLRVMC